MFEAYVESSLVMNYFSVVNPVAYATVTFVMSMGHSFVQCLSQLVEGCLLNADVPACSRHLIVVQQSSAVAVLQKHYFVGSVAVGMNLTYSAYKMTVAAAGALTDYFAGQIDDSVAIVLCLIAARLVVEAVVLVTLTAEKIVVGLAVIGSAAAVDHDDCNGCWVA